MASECSVGVSSLKVEETELVGQWGVMADFEFHNKQ